MYRLFVSSDFVVFFCLYFDIVVLLLIEVNGTFGSPFSLIDRHLKRDCLVIRACLDGAFPTWRFESSMRMQSCFLLLCFCEYSNDKR
jgi:hypothetical protein